MNSDQNIIIAVIGGGASGVLATLHFLASEQPLTVHLFNGRHQLGGGIAYSVSGDDLLLNVAASCMSAWSQRPRDFYQWLEKHHPGRYLETSFVPRRLYREYLQSALFQAERSIPPGRLQFHPTWVKQILPKKRGFLIQAGETQDVLADAVVLAMGNCLSNGSVSKGPGFTNDKRYVSNPWEYLAESHPTDTSKDVLVLGFGLTAVDVIIRLREQGHHRKIHVLSRRGRWPTAHSAYRRLDHFKLPELAGLSPRYLLRAVRRAIREVIAKGGDWRQVIDGLRSETNGLWAKWSFVERVRFLRHVRPYWDSNRHRMAHEIGDQLDKEIASGSVHLHTARLLSITPEKEGLRVDYRRRGWGQTDSVIVGQVINCTGSEVLNPSDTQPLVEKLVQLDLAKLDSFFPGLATNDAGELLDETGRPIPNLFTIGPVRRGTLWETTAIPEIRAQAEQLAKDVVTSVINTTESQPHHYLFQEAC